MLHILKKKKIYLINYMLATKESVGLAVIDLEKILHYIPKLKREIT